MSTFLLGSLSSLVSAVIGYWAGGLRKAAEDRKRRESLATALLYELRPLERMLRVRAKHSHAAESTVTISMPVFDRFAGDLLLFPPGTVHALLELCAYVRDIELTATQSNASRAQVIGENLHHYMRSKAAMAANALPPAKKALEAAGGQAPVDWEVETVPIGQTLALVDPAFPNAAKLDD